MFAVVVLGYLEEIARQIVKSSDLEKTAAELRKEIYDGIENFAITCKEGYGAVYAYEVDGYGQFNLMDDANVPSLLSMDYLGYEGKNPQVAEKHKKSDFKRSQSILIIKESRQKESEVLIHR